MINRFCNLILLVLLSAFCIPAQTVIKIPFVQSAPFTVQPQEVNKSIENNTSIELGLDTEIHGGSGNYSFSWSLNGSVVGTDPTLFVNEEGSYTLSVNDGEGCEAKSVYHVDTGMGITEPFENKVHIFPNPTDGAFFIKTPEIHQLRKLEIFKMDGKLMFSYPASHNVDEIRIEAGYLPVGSYLVVLQFENEKITKVLVIR